MYATFLKLTARLQSSWPRYDVKGLLTYTNTPYKIYLIDVHESNGNFLISHVVKALTACGIGCSTPPTVSKVGGGRCARLKRHKWGISRRPPISKRLFIKTNQVKGQMMEALGKDKLSSHVRDDNRHLKT